MNGFFKVLDPYRWVLAAVAALALYSGFGLYSKAQVNKGMRLAEQKQAGIENDRLREQIREIGRLTAVNKEVQDELDSINRQAADLERERERVADAQRLRDRAERAAAIARADAGALREHAARAEDDLDRSDADVARFGLEAVRASAVAHALDRTLRARDGHAHRAGRPTTNGSETEGVN